LESKKNGALNDTTERFNFILRNERGDATRGSVCRGGKRTKRQGGKVYEGGGPSASIRAEKLVSDMSKQAQTRKKRKEEGQVPIGGSVK